MQNGKKTSVVDIPRPAGATDLLNMDTYANALIKFIEDSDTPLTIAIQGEWGSGKTSLMNQLRANLCRETSSSFYAVWINTWQYALLSDEEVILSRILTAVTEKTVKAINERHPGKYNDSMKKVKEVGKALFKSALKIGASQVAGSFGESLIDEVAGASESAVTVSDLRQKLKDMIEKAIIDDHEKRGFLFFIDDLDRIEPVIAVQILELLKNIFDIPYCIFVLAIDYDVVVKGLEPKFGPLTDKNEREFRSFFDKIIQLPFTMPVGRYKTDYFIIKILDEIDYLDDGELKDEEFKRQISAMANCSVGRNPRSLKRLANSLSLIRMFNQLDSSREQKNDQPYEKIMNIGLICCQIAYPYIYGLLNKKSDFTSWNETTAARFKLEPLKEEDIEVLKGSEEFDEEWERVLYRACQKDSYLSNRSFRVSELLNLIANQLPLEKKNELGDVVDSLLSLSAVTSVEASSDAKPGEILSRSTFSGFDEFAENLARQAKADGFIELVRLVHNDVLQQFTDAQVAYGKGRISFSNPAFPRKIKTFLTLGAWRPPLKVKIEKLSPAEDLPEGAVEDWLKRDQDRYFNFNVSKPEDYSETVRGFIRRNYERGTRGIH